MAPSFGNYAVLSNVRHTLSKEPKWWWEIKPPTAKEEINLGNFIAKGRVSILPDGTRIDNPPGNVEVAIREIALSFAGTNMPAGEKAVEDGGEPLIAVGKSLDEIEQILWTMPLSLILELWDAVGEAIPSWGPIRPNLPKGDAS